MLPYLFDRKFAICPCVEFTSDSALASSMTNSGWRWMFEPARILGGTNEWNLWRRWLQVSPWWFILSTHLFLSLKKASFMWRKGHLWSLSIAYEVDVARGSDLILCPNLFLLPSVIFFFSTLCSLLLCTCFFYEDHSTSLLSGIQGSCCDTFQILRTREHTIQSHTSELLVLV